MPSSSVPLKTPAGQDELRHRTLKLSQRHRTVLLLVDGRRSVSQVLSLALQAGAATSHFEELVRLGLVQLPNEAAAPEPVETMPGALDLMRVQSLELDVPADGGVEAEADATIGAGFSTEVPQPLEAPAATELDQPAWPAEPDVALLEPLPEALPELPLEFPVDAPLELLLEPLPAVPEELPAEPQVNVLPDVAEFPQIPQPPPLAASAPEARQEPWMDDPPDPWATTAVLPPNVPTRDEWPSAESPVPPVAGWPELSAALPTPADPPVLREIPVRVLSIETFDPMHELRFEGPNGEYQLLAHVGDLLAKALSFDSPLFSTRTLMRVRMAQTHRELINLVWEIEHQFQRSRRAHGGSAALYEARELLGMGNTQVAGDSQAGWPEDEA